MSGRWIVDQKRSGNAVDLWRCVTSRNEKYSSALF